jgi:DNA-binding MarR family transcriptional regulator
MTGKKAEPDVFQDSENGLVLTLRYIAHISCLYSKSLEKELKITVGQLLCLRALLKEDRLPIREISKRTFLGSSTVTGLIDRLEAKGLVSRLRHNPDRRVCCVKLLEAGRRIAQTSSAPIDSIIAASLEKLSPQEIQTILSGLKRLLDSVTTVIDDSPRNWSAALQ